MVKKRKEKHFKSLLPFLCFCSRRIDTRAQTGIHKKCIRLSRKHLAFKCLPFKTKAKSESGIPPTIYDSLMGLVLHIVDIEARLFYAVLIRDIKKFKSLKGFSPQPRESSLDLLIFYFFSATINIIKRTLTSPTSLARKLVIRSGNLLIEISQLKRVI